MPILPTSAEMPASQESCSSTMLCLFPAGYLRTCRSYSPKWMMLRSGSRIALLRFRTLVSQFCVCCLRRGRISMLFDHSRIRGIQWTWSDNIGHSHSFWTKWRFPDGRQKKVKALAASSRRTCRHTRSVSTTSRLTSCSCVRRCCAILRLQRGSSARNKLL